MIPVNIYKNIKGFLVLLTSESFNLWYYLYSSRVVYLEPFTKKILYHFLAFY